ncbi:ABC transporter permease [Paenibacillus thalictri]|uniref:Sugar ABC transporter permease n=1 Tax=Paenibacillus thalictri TaxID=2527873 RepID=A0A4Q9DFB2_9BACL|nr:ABC transporter permease subunit [Paenibacillus thalictri]TBL70541.1 sugar ABC transporter permease [Paenibacillus thalictri]
MPQLTTNPVNSAGAVNAARRQALRKRLRGVTMNYQLYLFILPTLVYFIVFHYWPMYGVQIAFKDFNGALGIEGSPWAGLKHFLRFVHAPSFWTIITNTVGISLFQLVVGFPAPILLALLLNEIRSGKFRKVLQTVTYAPHFISIVVLVSMIMLLLNPSYGVVNKAIGLFGFESHDFMTDKSWFKAIYVLSDVWQNAGWSSIIYLAALAGIDQEQHEAAMIDGASRLQRIRHINIPGITPTIVILFLFAIGGIMTVGFEKVFLMQNPLNLEASEVISTYVYKVGLLQLQYSFSSAVGLFNTSINFILLLIVNAVVKRLGETSLW